MKKTYNLGIVGYGGMGKWHHLNMDRIDRVNPVAVCDIAKSARDRAESYGLKTYDNINKILKDDSIDILVIATPNHFHCPYAIKAMQAGKHVITEKPITTSSANLQKMIDASVLYDRKLSVHQNRRWDKDYLTIKKIVDDKMIGDVFTVSSRVMGSRGIPGDWRAKKAFGGGMMLDWGVHLIDQALHMFDSPVREVYVRMQHVHYSEVDDGFSLVLTFENGVVYTIDVFTSCYINLPRWHVCGYEGTAVINDWSCDGKIVNIQKGKENEDATPIEAGAGLTKTMAPRTDKSTVEHSLPHIECDEWVEYYGNYVNAIEGKEDLLVKPEQAMRVMRVMEAAFKSEKQNRSVKVNI